METATVAATIEAADAGVKGARVELLELRLGDGLGGKGYLLFDGLVSDVEAAVAIAVERIGGDGQGSVPGARAPIARVIPQLHREMRAEIEAAPRFGSRIGTGGRGGLTMQLARVDRHRRRHGQGARTWRACGCSSSSR